MAGEGYAVLSLRRPRRLYRGRARDSDPFTCVTEILDVGEVLWEGVERSLLVVYWAGRDADEFLVMLAEEEPRSVVEEARRAWRGLGGLCGVGAGVALYEALSARSVVAVYDTSLFWDDVDWESLGHVCAEFRGVRWCIYEQLVHDPLADGLLGLAVWRTGAVWEHIPLLARLYHRVLREHYEPGVGGEYPPALEAEEVSPLKAPTMAFVPAPREWGKLGKIEVIRPAAADFAVYIADGEHRLRGRGWPWRLQDGPA